MYYLVTKNNETNSEQITFVLNTGSTRTVTEEHPQYHNLMQAIRSEEKPSDDELIALIEAPEREIGDELITLSDRLQLKNGQLLVDGVIAKDKMTHHLLRMIKDNEANQTGFASFFDLVFDHMSDNTRERLFAWINSTDYLCLDENGYIIAYKNVEYDRSCKHDSNVCVNGEIFVSNPVYDLGAMAYVDNVDSDSAHNVGIQVSTWEQTQGNNSGTHIIVVFDPRDVLDIDEKEPGLLRLQKIWSMGIAYGPVQDSSFETSIGSLEDELLDDIYSY